MIFRTDLAMELEEQHRSEQIPGIVSQDETVGNLTINKIQITSEEAAQKIGKPIGEYVTVTVPPFSDDVTSANEEIEAMAQQIQRLINDDKGLVLVAGLGNHQITPDALGPKVIEGIIATRHIKGEVAEAAGLSHLRPVAAIAPGVLGQTGIETGEVVSSIVKDIQPSCVVAVDALASRSLDRLGCTVQISNTGISPGSGVANTRKELSKNSLGVPVVSIGVPTVVDGTTLAGDLLQAKEMMSDEQIRERFEPRGAMMMVTPREIDLVIQRAAKAISLAINRALQPKMSLDDIVYLSE
ncbi:spore protease [Hydrogenoanaerobacterium saccharovorans]|uniref:Germination protease n=1 Tax=Hydrogenoanaerobacterium saccharovorans TaxID=474960 RepID=A0A1H8CIV0_9FIRM|nr:GPR endopeptidase [Hydrogenoanaerobacterium saccharovorans]RPF43158.1 spore protease [Hydrogenoanaerobacterium saccharovorans]SEM95221.1 spore protease [Hydrogenoanaerobacterium saccharovorans]